MINNRQGGRRRGRGGQRPQGNPGRPEQGNRIDNRARGNAQQLHEKYKNLARDAQMAGDRVTTEYYLQFADHYFRVLSESRARFEDQRRPRDDAAEDDFDEGEEFDAAPEARPQRRPEQRERAPRRNADDGQGNAPAAPSPAEADADGDGETRRTRRPRRRREEGEDGEAAAPAIEADRLPPAIAIEPADAGSDDAAGEAPRRRTRRPRAAAADPAPEANPGS